MGCGPSTPHTNPHAGGITNIGEPVGAIRMVPQQKRDRNNRPVLHSEYDLSPGTLHRALQDVAKFMRDHHQDVTMVTVGGAVNTIYLKTRETTNDVDFFGADLTRNQLGLLEQAAAYADSRARGNGGPGLQRLGGACSTTPHAYILDLTSSDP
ncbi:MAG: hypothetical protein M1831_007077 [Alyxoria varia]|nr:MAG: hypothetical protein M1831_007077 [Alyxoria varia]